MQHIAFPDENGDGIWLRLASIQMSARNRRSLFCHSYFTGSLDAAILNPDGQSDPDFRATDPGKSGLIHRQTNQNGSKKALLPRIYIIII